MERSDFRIIEKLNNYGDSIFIPQIKSNKLVGSFLGIWGGRMEDVWEDLRLEVYKCVVNNQHEFKKILFVGSFKYQAEETIKLYMEHISRKTIEYRGRKLIPIIDCINNYDKYLTYYDPDGYYEIGRWNYGYHTYRNIDDFKKYVDKKLDAGKVLKIHD